MTFEEVLDSCPNLKAHCYITLKSWGFTAAEAYQEGLVAMFFLLRKGYTADNITPIVRTTVKNACIDKRRVTAGQIEYQSDEYDDGLFASKDEYDEDSFYALIEELPKEHKELITLRYLYGYELGELEAHFKLPRGTIKSRLSRTLDKLRVIHNARPD